MVDRVPDLAASEERVHAAFAALSLPDTEEVSGELLRRVGVALRRIGERRADEPDAERLSPRRRVAALIAATELAAATLGAIAAGAEAPSARLDRDPATVSALVYAAPTTQALLARLEQDRRLLTSLARALESRFAETHATPWGQRSLHSIVAQIALEEPARSAQVLERLAVAQTL